MSIGLGFLNVANANSAPAGITYSEFLELIRDTQRGDLRDELKKKKKEPDLYFSPFVSNWYERDDFVRIPSEKSSTIVFVSAALLYAVLDLTRDDALRAVAKGLTIEKVCAMLETRHERLEQFIKAETKLFDKSPDTTNYKKARDFGFLNWAAPPADNDDNTHDKAVA